MINKEEYRVLMGLDDKWEWIARDLGSNRDGNLFAYSVKPFKHDIGVWDYDRELHHIDNRLFQFIQWKNDEPYNIQKLVEEYEGEEAEVKKDIEWTIKEIEGLETEPSQNYPHDEMIEKEIVLGILSQLNESEVTLDRAFEKVAESYPMTKGEICRHLERLAAYGGKVTYGEPYSFAELMEEYESEETEVKKDKKWLVDKWTKERNETEVDDPMYQFISEFIADINQLDEKEDLSPDWIRDNIEYAYYMTPRGTYSSAKAVIDPGKLQNLLVPDPELPVIPKFVADWIEGNKEFEEKWNDYSKEDAMNDTIHFTIYGLFADYPATNSDVELRKPVIKWLSVDRGNYFKLVNSVRYGYEVEEEQKYYVILEENSYGAIGLGIDSVGDLTFTATHDKGSLPKLTEQEIKDYDPRYWPFAVKVEELERE